MSVLQYPTVGGGLFQLGLFQLVSSSWSWQTGNDKLEETKTGKDQTGNNSSDNSSPTVPPDLLLCSSPHLRILDLGFEFDARSTFDRLMLRSATLRQILTRVSLDLSAGDTLALLYTTESEMQTLCRVLSYINLPPGRVQGVLELNGHRLKPRQFGQRVAYVPNLDPAPGLTLLEHLRLYSSFVMPATNAHKRNEMVGGWTAETAAQLQAGIFFVKHICILALIVCLTFFAFKCLVQNYTVDPH